MADERRRHGPAYQRADCSAFVFADAADEQPDRSTYPCSDTVANNVADT